MDTVAAVKYGFQVEHQTENYWPNGYGNEPEKEPDDRWIVTLPHQCESWGISGVEKLYDAYPEPVSQERAVADLEAFIAEAQDALDHLKRGEEVERPDYQD